MFIYFNKNKLRYEKGQLAPFFILILAVLIVMAMVTVNLSKVAFIKTDSSNAVDAGALAAGSVMANVFNAVAQANSQMETSYWSFYTAVSVSFAIAFASLIVAHLAAIAAETAATAAQVSAGIAITSAATALASACLEPCAAIAPAKAAVAAIGVAIGKIGAALLATAKAITAMAWFIRTTWAILIAVTGFYVAQQYFYLSIREMAWKGRESAIEMAHRFTFMNSGIGSKLKAGEPPDEITEPERRRNYREVFSDFLDTTIDNDKDIEGDIQLEYTYAWKDGQARDHSVLSRVDIDEVDTFDLRVTALPFPLEAGLLGTSLGFAYSAKGSLVAAETSYGIALGTVLTGYSNAEINYSVALVELVTACGLEACCYNFWTAAACCPPRTAAMVAAEAALTTGIEANALGLAANATGLIANAAAMASMIPIYPLMGAAWVGLLPGPIITDSDGVSALPFIICWIDDIMDPNHSDEPHNRLVRVETWQAHQGQDWGLWKTKYPAEWNPLVHPEPLPNERIESYSIVNFTGQGQIHPPELRHDASIIETDRIGTQ